MVRVVAISDTHSFLPDVEPCDILLLGGDICDNGSAVAQVGWLYDVFKPWLEKIPAKHVVGIAGNHDLVFGKNSELVPRNLKWNYLQGTVIELEGLKIYGLPWSLPIWGAFQLDEEGLARKCSQIPNDIDIIVSHGPPYGIGDGVPRLITDQNEHEWPGVEHVGSFALRERVFDIRPLLTVFGHIHEGRGYWHHGWPDEKSCVLANISQMNGEFKPIHKPMVFDVDKENKKVEIIRG